MKRTTRKDIPLEFKGTTLPIVSVTPRTLHVEELGKAAQALFGDERFFDGDAAVLELDGCVANPEIDWAALIALCAHHGLRVIGVRGGAAALHETATAAGLPVLTEFKRTARAIEAAPTAAPPAQEPPPRAEPPVPPSVPTRIVDRPLRSGQQVYARGGDLVVLAAVNAGAEVIADGSIHIYAPLRGRALAGAQGDTHARIFTTRFEAELVSIAGVYRTFESDVAAHLAGHPVQVQLAPDGERLDLAPLKTD